MIGDVIRSLRKKKALNQGEFASVLGVKQEMVCRWETNKCVPSMRSIRKIADALEVEPTQLTKYL